MEETVVFMNMCMVCNGTQVLALDKVSGNYHGTTFPGGHVEKNETFSESVIREIFEETGLLIKHPILKGIYHWYDEGVHNIGLMYKATEYTGTLKASSEGRVYWIEKEKYAKKELAIGMPKVLQMMDDDNITEIFMNKKEDGSIEELTF